MDSTVKLVLLYDYYGDLLTERQKQCFELKYHQDLSLAEIAQELHVSRQGVYDNLSRAESELLKMEEKTGCARRDQDCRRVAAKIRELAQPLAAHSDGDVRLAAARLMEAAASLEE